MLSDSIKNLPMEPSLHFHDWILLAAIIVGAIIVYRFFVAKTKDKKSPIDAADLWLDDTTRRVSWSKTMGAGGIALLGAVLVQQAIAGKDLSVIYVTFGGTVIGPIIARIIKGGEPVTPADYSSPIPKPAPPPPAPAIVAGTTTINT